MSNWLLNWQERKEAEMDEQIYNTKTVTGADDVVNATTSTADTLAEELTLVGNTNMPGGLFFNGGVQEKPKGETRGKVMDEDGIRIGLENRAIFNLQDPEDGEALFNINGVEVISTKAFSLFSGQKKSGKSNFAGVLITAAVNSEGKALNGTVCSLRGKLKVLYCDTEQPKRDVKRLFRRVMKTAFDSYDIEWTETGIHVISLRDDDPGAEETKGGAIPTTRWGWLIEAAMEYKPDIIFIDGLADLLKSVNDEGESLALLKLIDRLASELNCAIVAMLHQNPGGTKITGWAGTNAGKKYSDGFSVSKKNNCFTVEHEGRGKPTPSLTFQIACPEGDNVGWYASISQEEATMKREEELRRLLASATYPAYTSDMSKYIKQQASLCKYKGGTSDSSIARTLKEAVELGILNKEKIGKNDRYSWKLKDDAKDNQPVQLQLSLDDD